ncbi:MAG: hypothetical protein FWF54_02520 [Candidatus Azobacteroides sp.]|nr:hypothetical protein [Candidatus Azobacteroides sp.]
MNNEIKEEITEQVNDEVIFGFSTKEEIFDDIMDVFYDEEVDEAWLKTFIDEKYEAHLEESKTWERPTDYEKLAAVFEELNEENIISLHKAGYTEQDGYDDVVQVADILREDGVEPAGYCFYHTQDLERAVNPEIRNLFLCFDSFDQDDKKTVGIGKMIVGKLNKAGFKTSWDGTADQRIEIKGIGWLKTSEEEEEIEEEDD